jgi:hypothetical protein
VGGEVSGFAEEGGSQDGDLVPHSKGERATFRWRVVLVVLVDDLRESVGEEGSGGDVARRGVLGEEGVAVREGVPRLIWVDAVKGGELVGVELFLNGLP